MPEHMTSQSAQVITTGLLRRYNLFGWTVKFGYAKRTAGSCDYRRKVITLSKYLMAQRSYEETQGTITHEVAHALTPGHHHDWAWQKQHKAMGGDGKRCFQHFDEKAPWVGECPHGTKFARYRAPKTLDGYRCNCRSVGGTVTWTKRSA